MLADMQRARALAWELPALGWDVEVLTPAASEVRQDAIEPDADSFFAPETPVHEVHVWAPRLFRLLTLGAGVWRMWLPMFWRGRALLASGRFDLVYFTTTAFNFFVFGPRWRRIFGIPYVLDFQDPWVLSREHKREGLKARLSALIDPAMEKSAVVNAAALIAVSEAYIRALEDRYGKRSPPWLREGRHRVIPFCALERDLVGVPCKRRDASARPSSALALHYVGAGPTMRKSFSLICRALSQLRECGDDLAERVRIRLFGTGSIGGHAARLPLRALACQAGVGDLVDESPQRVSYRRSLELMRDSDGLLVLGVDDAGYMPSKLFGYALSRKPLLACLRKDGPAYAFFQANAQLGRSLWFDAAGSMPPPDAAAVLRQFLEETAAGARFDRRAMLEAHLAPAMARRHVEVFELCLADAPPRLRSARIRHIDSAAMRRQ
jgi:glycosyltransferase involved in cell wall biosynthesis